MKFSESKVLITLSSIILGFLLASQIGFGKNFQEEYVSLQDYQRMTSDIKKKNNDINNLAVEKKALEDKIYEYKYLGQSVESTVDKLGDELNKVEFNAGLDAVKGPGVSIYLSDSKYKESDTSKREISDEALLVHDGDLRDLVWELRNAGAEAISVNGERVVSSTEFSCNGPVIYINGSKYTPPYIINAIGDTESLAYALNKEFSVYNGFIERSLNVRFSNEKNIVIPKYSGDIKPIYAKPIK